MSRMPGHTVRPPPGPDAYSSAFCHDTLWTQSDPQRHRASTIKTALIRAHCALATYSRLKPDLPGLAAGNWAAIHPGFVWAAIKALC